MPGGYPYHHHHFQLKEIQGHLSTQLWNEVVEEVRGDFSPEDVLLPPEPDDEHVVHSPPGLGESLRTLSDVHTQEQSLQELLQLTSPPAVPRPLTASPSPGTETPPSSDPATPTDLSDSSMHIDLNFDDFDVEDVDASGGNGILLPEPRPTRTPSPPHPRDYMLMLVRFGICQVRPHEHRPGPPPPPGLKPSIMGSAYLADLVSVASDFSEVLHTSRPKSATKAVASRPAEYGAAEDIARAMALGHAHCALYDLFDADVRIAPNSTYEEIIGGLLSALVDGPVMSYSASTGTGVAVLELLQLGNLITSRPALAMGVRPDSIRLPLNRDTSNNESQCGWDLVVPMLSAGVAWGPSPNAESEGWFPWLFIEPLGLRGDQAAANVRLFTAMRVALGIYSKLFKAAQTVKPVFTQPRAHVTTVVYGLQTCGVMWRLFAMVDKDNETFPVSTIWSGNVEEPESMARAVGVLRKISHEVEERLQCIRNWIACVCGIFGSSKLITPSRKAGSDALAAMFSSPTSRLKRPPSAVRITEPMPLRSPIAAAVLKKSPEFGPPGFPVTLKHSRDNSTSTPLSLAPGSPIPSRQDSPAEKKFRPWVPPFQPRAASAAPSLPTRQPVRPPPGFENVFSHPPPPPPPPGLVGHWAPAPVLYMASNVNWSNNGQYNTWGFGNQGPPHAHDPYPYGHAGQPSQSFFGPVGGFAYPDRRQGAPQISGGPSMPIGPGPIGSRAPSYATVASKNANYRNGGGRIAS
ncbi:uncharacterized protein LOC62_04G005483 [Vanrija pseudolonga]|uniref:Uncharacterized protein n=1 Tax=Vanrija pseudolonga TaxID=143232 RepID=A0AAF0Y9Q7_9TREE|nr:hypothetical protein LOC62_04G005483 [Vanrija pseudolonga]